MKNIIILILLLIIPLIGFSQVWKETYGGNDDDEGFSVQQTTDGGYIVCGGTTNTLWDGYLLKIDGNGLEQWSKIFSGLGTGTVFNSVQQTTDGGYIICGNTGGYVYIVKTDENGIEQWNHIGGTVNTSTSGHSVQQTSDGGYIVVGHQDSDIFVIKINSNGSKDWQETYGGSLGDIGLSIQQTTDGGYIITGETDSFGNGNSDVYMLKLSGWGVEQWNKTFGGTGYDYGLSIQQTTDGGYVIVGGTGSFGNGHDAYLVKTDENGIEQWIKTFGYTSYDDWGCSVQQTNDGGYIFCGAQGDNDWIWLVKTDSYGDTIWTKNYTNDYFPNSGNEVGNSVQQTTDGGYIVTGRGYDLTGQQVVLIKTNSYGNITSTFNIPINPNRKLEKIVDVLGRKITPKNNIPFIEIYNDGSTDKKIIID